MECNNYFNNSICVRIMNIHKNAGRVILHLELCKKKSVTFVKLTFNLCYKNKKKLLLITKVYFLN